MHSTSFNTDVCNSNGGDVLVSVATLVTEGRLPGDTSGCDTAGGITKSKKFYEGPHCTLVKGAGKGHKCETADPLCLKYERDRETVLNQRHKDIPLCIEVILTCPCREIEGVEADSLDDVFVLEQWHFSVSNKRSTESPPFNLNQLVSAIRSQLYFSQITAWLMTQDEQSAAKITADNFRYHLTVPGKSLATTKFHLSANKHEFPTTQIENGLSLNVSFFSRPRSSTVPDLTCKNCSSQAKHMKSQGTTNVPAHCKMDMKNGVLDDRMHLSCTMKGKHRCEDFEEEEHIKIEKVFKRVCQNNKVCEASTSKTKPKLKIYIQESMLLPSSNGCEKRNISPNDEQKSKSVKLDMMNGIDDLKKDKGRLLLEAIERSGQKSTNERRSESDIANCDKKSESDIFSIKRKNNFNIYVDKHCDSPIPILRHKEIRDLSNVIDLSKLKRSNAKQKIRFDDDSESSKHCDKITCDDKSKDDKEMDIPSATEQAKFRKNLDNAASMVFHSRTGLPLTSSPAPVRRGKFCFDFDSSINSVSAINSALFSNSFSTDEESESEGSSPSPCSPESFVVRDDIKEVSPPIKKYRRKGHAANLLGSFEESVLNGRLEPVSTVHGFTAELGASGSFVPKHLIVPVTVFFYTLGDNDKVSSPYLSHINLGKKGYNVPKSGTVQVTLFNPLGTVVKMFVIMYDLNDMPPNSQTFIRQRTLYMPTNCKDPNLEWGPKWLRYLIHLRFMSSKSGKIYLHSDIRMIIFRKCDMDTATAHGIDMSYELRSFTHMPANPRFSPRK